MISAADIHERIDWPKVLVHLGIPEAALRNKHGPCPSCGGKDCFRFDHAKRGKGSFYCNKFGSGDGFKLLQHVYGWAFPEARQRVIASAGLNGSATTPMPPLGRLVAQDPIATPSDRVKRLRRERCAIENSDDAVDYLASRFLWPLPEGCTLSAHSSLDYWDENKRIGKYPAIVADVTDLAGDLVTVHVTYLQGGKKLTLFEPRKLLGRCEGREGCAVRLMAATDTLGIAEGIETALAASVIHGEPVWAALNTSLLSKFEPPPGVIRLRIYGDRDLPGLTAVANLMERLQGRVAFEKRIPPPPHKDWSDVLTAKNSRQRGEGISNG